MSHICLISIQTQSSACCPEKLVMVHLVLTLPLHWRPGETSSLMDLTTTGFLRLDIIYIYYCPSLESQLIQISVPEVVLKDEF